MRLHTKPPEPPLDHCAQDFPRLPFLAQGKLTLTIPAADAEAVGFELRLRGKTYVAIAEIVGPCDRSGARNAIRRCITERAGMAFDMYRVQRFLEREEIN